MIYFNTFLSVVMMRFLRNVPDTFEAVRIVFDSLTPLAAASVAPFVEDSSMAYLGLVTHGHGKKRLVHNSNCDPPIFHRKQMVRPVTASDFKQSTRRKPTFI